MYSGYEPRLCVSIHSHVKWSVKGRTAQWCVQGPEGWAARAVGSAAPEEGDGGFQCPATNETSCFLEVCCVCMRSFTFKKPKIFVCFKQRWFRTRLQLKRVMQLYHDAINTQREVQQRLTRRDRAASVIQRAVRRFLLRKRQEKSTSGIVKFQVTGNILVLVQDWLVVHLCEI